jgi:two-component system, OmpR family, sensor histidine kinase KdpD
MLAQISSSWDGLNKSQRFWAGVAAGAVLSVFSGLLATTLEAELGVRAPSMSFLLSVILAAIWFGRRVALITAIFAFLVYNFYLVEPRYTFGFAGFEDVFKLLVFISVALLIGTMAGNLHDQRERARQQVRVLSGLFTVSRSMAECTSEREALEQLASGAREVVAQDAVVYGEDGVGIGEPSPPGTGDVLSTPWQREDINAEGERVAVLAWKRAEKAPGAEQAIAVRLLAELARVAIERTRIVQRRVEMDTLAATERLRTALLSSISHDFRTPISTILTSASSLRAFGDQFPPATSADLLVTIEEEAERLNRFVGNVLNMTRLEANVVKPRVEWIDPLEIIEAVQQRLSKRVLEDNFVITTPAAVPSIFVDPLLLEQALVNVIENALVHASGGKLHIGADYGDGVVRMWVEDEGPGVPQSDLTRIFDKFHRLDGSRNTQGVGLGLAITKGFVEAMKGEVSATSPVRNGRGLRVEFAFPMQADLEAA